MLRPFVGSRALLILAGAALLIRIVATAEPLGIDQSLWASAVRGMAHGQQLYVDVWEQRPPGIYVTYLAGFSLLGWTEATVAWLDIMAAAATTILLWRLGRRLADETTGALAAALYAVLTMPAGLYGYGGFLERSVCETFIVVCVAAAALGATRLRERESAGWAIVVGAFGGLAAIYKPNAALYLPAIAAWWWFVTPPDRRSSAVAVRTAGWMIAGALLPAVLAFAWLWQAGALADARTAIVDFNRYYVTEGLGTLRHAWIFADRVLLRFKTEPVWTGGIAASLVACGILLRTRNLPPLPALALCWGGAATLVILVNGIRLFNSYFLQAHAPLCLMAAWWLASRTSTAPLQRLGRLAVAVAMLAVLFSSAYVVRAAERTRADWRYFTGQTDRVAYLEEFGGYANARGYSARANQELADYIGQHTTPDETVFLFGINGAGVYFLADRITAHRFLRVNFFYPDGFPDPHFTLDAVTSDLARARPRYLVFENLHGASVIGEAVSRIASEPTVAALLEAYEFEAQIEDFAVYRRASQK